MGISIIIPLYNKEKYIKKVIESVLKQSFQDFEVIIVDDGSTDKSASIVETINDNRIRLVKKCNGGVSAARNYGLQFVSTDLVFYLDADDILMPNTLDTLYKLYLRHPNCDIFTGNFIQSYPKIKKKLYCVGKKEYVIEDNFQDFYKQKFYLRTGIFLVKKEILEKSSTCTVEHPLSACHPIAYFPLSNPFFHFSVDYCCSNNGKCSASLS